MKTQKVQRGQHLNIPSIMQSEKSSKVIFRQKQIVTIVSAFVLFEPKRHLVFLFAPEVPIFALKDIAQQTAGQLVNWSKDIKL